MDGLVNRLIEIIVAWNDPNEINKKNEGKTNSLF